MDHDQVVDEEIEVPPFFLCPISLEIMKDPITLSTGITYDRDSIEKWVFSGNTHTCPVTQQPLSVDPSHLTPNHTLRRLIQSWCTIHASQGIQRIPTPKPPITIPQISKLLQHASQSPHQSLQTLKSLASESEANKRTIESAPGALEFLASIILNNNNNNIYNDDDALDFKTNPAHEALLILHTLHVSPSGLNTLLVFHHGELLPCLTTIMQRGFYDSRAYAVLLLHSLLQEADSTLLNNLKPQTFVELVQIAKDQISPQATKAALRTLIHVCVWGRNRIRAVEAGGVSVLIEMLLDCNERKYCEMMLVLLEILCGCAEGRAELLSHGAGMAIVSKKILRVSTLANDRATRILMWIARFSATASVLQEMMAVGVVAKLCLVIQVDSGNKAKEKAREILRMHAKAWRNSPCLPTNLLTSYPI